MARVTNARRSVRRRSASPPPASETSPPESIPHEQPGVAPAPALPIPAAAEPGGLHSTRRDFAARLAAAGERETIAASLRPAEPEHGAYDDPDLVLMAGAFDAGYYIGRYPDVLQSGSDPLLHFATAGWWEGRDPTSWFDTEYYLASSPDVREAGMNPFLHYLRSGRAEGRWPRLPARHQRIVLQRLRDAEERTRDWAVPDHVEPIPLEDLTALLRERARHALGISLALSHDCYVRSVGGTQLLIADEQRRFNARGELYLQVSPVIPRLVLAGEATPFLLQLVADGKELGAVAADALAEALGGLDGVLPPTRRFIVHSMFGHAVGATIALHDALAPGDDGAVFWLHDYASICVGYNLLRNDVVFCGAPPPGSMACRICIYGTERRRHQAGMRRLFGAIAFRVVAPSATALDLWLAHAELPHRSATVHPHAKILPAGQRAAGAAELPARIAFIGHPAANKGWPVFEELVSRTWKLGAYEFLHLSSETATPPLAWVRTVPARVTPEHRDRMRDLVEAEQIDLVVVLSTWPETFCYVASEALAGGADVVALADSGNVAAMLADTGRGVIARDADAVFSFFESLQAVQYVRLCREQGIPLGRIEHDGTTASLPFAEGAAALQPA
ncbi:MAG TPA: hypothetical protein VME92_07970 [Acetobacteraceae bacterium]|nr:hypothetical protein [Acetobacteraceae bacterium]